MGLPAYRGLSGHVWTSPVWRVGMVPPGVLRGRWPRKRQRKE